jgi:hypothetical protein
MASYHARTYSLTVSKRASTVIMDPTLLCRKLTTAGQPVSSPAAHHHQQQQYMVSIWSEKNQRFFLSFKIPIMFKKLNKKFVTLTEIPSNSASNQQWWWLLPRLQHIPGSGSNAR